MSCNCFEEMKEKLKEKALELISHDINKVTKYGFDNQVIRFSGNKNDVPLTFTLKYIRTRKNGVPELKESKKEINLFMTFCPFCGKKFD